MSKDNGKQGSQVERCPSCSEAHNVDLVAYNTKRAGWTHWYKCPKTDDPVPVMLVMDAEGNPIELDAEIIEHLVAGHRAGRWLVAHYYEENGRLHKMRKWVNFPNAEFGEVVRYLREELENHVGPAAQKPQVLTPAEIGSIPRLNLFGNRAPS